MPGMNDSEAWAIRKMANAAKRSNVRLARWLEHAPTSKGRVAVWVCGWYTEDHPDDMHHVGWRWTKEEISELCVSAGGVVQRDRKAEENQDPRAGQCQSGRSLI